MTEIVVPEPSLVVLVGVSGSGKSTFAARHFLPSEAVSSDACRALVADDPDDQAASADAFDLLRYISAKRLKAGRLTVVDATNTSAERRRPLVALAREHHVPALAIVLDVPLGVCRARNTARGDRAVAEQVLRRQREQLRRGLPDLRREGFSDVHVLNEVEQVVTTRERSRVDRRDERGPFDIVGDIHGCREELVALLGELGYRVSPGGDDAEHPDGRRAVFLGDLVDRGPDSPGVLSLVMGMVEHGHALCVPGNHEAKLERALAGRRVKVGHGLGETLAQLAREPPEFTARVRSFLGRLVSHAVLDGGELVVAHAGLAEHLQGRESGAVRAFALYGDTTGETDEDGLPVRYPWAQDYRGAATVVYGHTPVAEPRWLNRTLCIDTGCVFGGRLTALRWPERELVAVPAARTYQQPVRPLSAAPAAPSRPRQ